MPSFSLLLSPSRFRSIQTTLSLLLSVSHPYHVKQQQRQRQQHRHLPRSYLFLLLVLTSLCSPLWVSLAHSAPSTLPHSISISGSSLQQPPQLNSLAAALEPELEARAGEKLAKALERVKRYTPQKNAVNTDIKYTTPSKTTTMYTSTSKPTMAPTPTSTHSASSSPSAPSTSSSSASMVNSSIPSPVLAPSPSVTMNLPDKGDLQLFGRPSVIGGYNLTTSILVCGFITLVFLITIAVATIKRAQFRKQFRRDIEKNKLMEAGRAAAVGKDGKGGKGGKGAEAKGAKSSESEVKEKDTSRDAVNLPSRQPSFRRALMEDARRENEDRTARTRTPDNNRNERRQDGAGIKFDTLESPIDRNGSFRNQQQPEPQPRSDRARDEMNARFQGRDRQQGVQDYPVNYDDVYQDEYTLPPLTASSTDDAYYSGGFSNAIQAYQYSSPQLPDLAYQQQQAPRPLQPVKRTGSNRLPNGNVPVASPKSLDRAPSFSRNERPRPKITTQGLVERAGSSVSSRSNSSSGSNVSSPIDRYGRFGRGGGSPVAQFEMDSYPSSIARSNNSRLPLEMRSAAGNDRGYSPSGLSQAQNGRSAGNYM